MTTKMNSKDTKRNNPQRTIDVRYDPEMPAVDEYQKATGCTDYEAFCFGEALIFNRYRLREGEPFDELKW